jgi:hypothetical protein
MQVIGGHPLTGLATMATGLKISKYSVSVPNVPGSKYGNSWTVPDFSTPTLHTECLGSQSLWKMNIMQEDTLDLLLFQDNSRDSIAEDIYRRLIGGVRCLLSNETPLNSNLRKIGSWPGPLADWNVGFLGYYIATTPTHVALL